MLVCYLETCVSHFAIVYPVLSSRSKLFLVQPKEETLQGQISRETQRRVRPAWPSHIRGGRTPARLYEKDFSSTWWVAIIGRPFSRMGVFCKLITLPIHKIHSQFIKILEAGYFVLLAIAICVCICWTDPLVLYALLELARYCCRFCLNWFLIFVAILCIQNLMVMFAMWHVCVKSPFIVAYRCSHEKNDDIIFVWNHPLLLQALTVWAEDISKTLLSQHTLRNLRILYHVSMYSVVGNLWTLMKFSVLYCKKGRHFRSFDFDLDLVFIPRIKTNSGSLFIYM